jgi:hypothetical protein
LDVDPLALTVLYPTLVNTQTVPMADSTTATDQITVVDVRDHGLFVAGLVHAVAPASEIRLISVLNESGCGDLFLLGTELGHFVGEVTEERAKAKKGQKPLEGVVINLSLGVRDLTLEDVASPDKCAPKDDDPVGLLCQVLSNAHEEGAVIVAAAAYRPPTALARWQPFPKKGICLHPAAMTV